MKIISGGQTGADIAALKAANDNNILIGGWCPPDRKNEEGIIADIYPLIETPEDRSIYAPNIAHSLRTDWNIRDSDATILFIPRNYILDPGSTLTISFISYYKKLFLDCNPMEKNIHEKIVHWIKSNKIEVLNIAGPRESSYPGIYKKVYPILNKVFSKLNQSGI